MTSCFSLGQLVMLAFCFFFRQFVMLSSRRFVGLSLFFFMLSSYHHIVVLSPCHAGVLLTNSTGGTRGQYRPWPRRIRGWAGAAPNSQPRERPHRQKGEQNKNATRFHRSVRWNFHWLIRSLVVWFAVCLDSQHHLGRLATYSYMDHTDLVLSCLLIGWLWYFLAFWFVGWMLG